MFVFIYNNRDMDKKVFEIKFVGYNWWGNEVYMTRRGTPIVRLTDDNRFHSLADSRDIDSDPDVALDSRYLKVVEEFSDVD